MPCSKVIAAFVSITITYMKIYIFSQLLCIQLILGVGWGWVCTCTRERDEVSWPALKSSTTNHMLFGPNFFLNICLAGFIVSRKESSSATLRHSLRAGHKRMFRANVLHPAEQLEVCNLQNLMVCVQLWQSLNRKTMFFLLSTFLFSGSNGVLKTDFNFQK